MTLLHIQATNLVLPILLMTISLLIVFIAPLLIKMCSDAFYTKCEECFDKNK